MCKSMFHFTLLCSGAKSSSRSCSGRILKYVVVGLLVVSSSGSGSSVSVRTPKEDVWPTYILTYNFGHGPLLTMITPSNLDVFYILYGCQNIHLGINGNPV